jgi:hypothetical protein
MNVLDLMIIALFMVLLGIGFTSGVWRCMSALISLAIALVGPSFFFVAVGDALKGLFPSINDRVADLGAFIGVTLGFGFAIDYVILRSFRTSRLRTHLTF